ncbi:uncharacterized protein LOC129590701 [Paramacrobiotus metropolitanus]|uniref:uncharacterized protein LOC129590701 n=1 Tax=Paramacrobiotus metropolitanus TaxID=2943436 RepID=UPI002445BCD9|nr:uncharacterized protein LOC129590701 [Paramacrobiotus metropolitanus]XP_055342028.1 uncharacterized protein LOC129590701 [Paramacrobiotus metropolitanus]
MAERSQTDQKTEKGRRPSIVKVTGDPLTNYNKDCPDCKRNNILSGERFPCWECVVAVPMPNQLLVIPQEAKRGNLDVFRHLVRRKTWLKLSPEDRVILEDKYRMWVGRRPGWDVTLEPPKTAEANAFRKQILQEKREAERKRLKERKKAAAEKGLANADKGHAGLAAPVSDAIFKKQDVQEAIIRESLIQQLDIILKDPLSLTKEEHTIFLQEKVNLTEKGRWSQVIKILIEDKIENMRKFLMQQNEMTETERNFKRGEFKRPKSPPRETYQSGLARSADRNERSHVYERSSDHPRQRLWKHERSCVYERSSDHSRKRSRELERSRVCERSSHHPRERSRDLKSMDG